MDSLRLVSENFLTNDAYTKASEERPGRVRVRPSISFSPRAETLENNSNPRFRAAPPHHFSCRVDYTYIAAFRGITPDYYGRSFPREIWLSENRQES